MWTSACAFAFSKLPLVINDKEWYSLLILSQPVKESNQMSASESREVDAEGTFCKSQIGFHM